MTETRLDNILREFDTINLDEMDNVRLMNREDTKFVFSYDNLLNIMPMLEEHYRILKVDDNLTSRYESVYFDTEDHELYVDHHRKKVDRYKVRYRKYVNSDLSFLEVKHKFKGRTDKKRIVVDDIMFRLTEEHEQFVKEAGVDHVNELETALKNNFNRITLVSKKGKERLTLDINLEYELGDKKELIEDVVIAELKQENASRLSPFYKILKKMQIRPYRVSKYCIGLIKLLGEENIKYNRFKKKLLKIKKLNEHAA